MPSVLRGVGCFFFGAGPGPVPSPFFGRPGPRFFGASCPSPTFCFFAVGSFAASAAPSGVSLASPSPSMAAGAAFSSRSCLSPAELGPIGTFPSSARFSFSSASSEVAPGLGSSSATTASGTGALPLTCSDGFSEFATSLFSAMLAGVGTV